MIFGLSIKKKTLKTLNNLFLSLLGRKLCLGEPLAVSVRFTVRETLMWKRKVEILLLLLIFTTSYKRFTDIFTFPEGNG